jgi:hypothetical protein
MQHPAGDLLDGSQLRVASVPKSVQTSLDTGRMLRVPDACATFFDNCKY